MTASIKQLVFLVFSELFIQPPVREKKRLQSIRGKNMTSVEKEEKNDHLRSILCDIFLGNYLSAGTIMSCEVTLHTNEQVSG